MRKAKKILIKILPIFFIAILTIALMLVLYTNAEANEIENCWERLDESAMYVSDKLSHSFADNLNLLCRVADAIVMKEDMQTRESVLAYIKSVRENTIFERIDILFSNGDLISEDGVLYPRFEGQLGFDVLAEKGAHISGRYTDHNFGKEVIYSTAPIEKDGEVTALLIGVIDCKKLVDQFPVLLYENRAQMFLIDRGDGKFLIDNWHEKLSSLDEIGKREKIDGYEDVDFVGDVKAGKEGRFAFVSVQNGKTSYMSYIPVDGFDWTLAIMVQKDIVLEDVETLNNVMKVAGIIMLELIVAYIIWSVVVVSGAVKNEEKAHRADLEREKNEAKSVFLSSMSHDIKTPLNGIIGMLNVIDSRGDDPEITKDCLQKIRISANYLTTLAEDVLDINELESGKVHIKKDPLDIIELVEKVNILVRQRAKDAGVRYHYDTSRIQHPYVLGSESHIQRILVNIVGNAIKYNKPNGDVWLSVDEQNDPYGRIYVFTVRDTGIGMSEEFQKNMFVAFEQENAGARTQNRGHGLGLTIVKRLVEKMNGSIEVESRVNMGTTFRIRIPLERDIMHADVPQEADEGSGALNKTRILLVEDNELNMEIAKVILSDAGAEILTAENGKQALEIFSASGDGSIDVILMDVMMPEMDGLEATRRIRAMERADAEKVPIIAMTAGTFADDISKCIKSGMNDIIGKPLDMGAVIELVLKHRNRI